MYKTIYSNLKKIYYLLNFMNKIVFGYLYFSFYSSSHCRTLVDTSSNTLD